MKTTNSAAKLIAKNLNVHVREAQYAVRGAIVQRSMELQKKLAEGNKLAFDSVISCNIGNPQALNQKPLTFLRDVLSLVLNPSLMDRDTTGIFKEDVRQRASKYTNATPSVGAYSESQGLAVVREEVADFLGRRDGIAGDPSSIFLTNGASDGVRLCMQTIIRDPHQEGSPRDGILVPIPQYPLYSALSTLTQAELIPYYLDEGKGWQVIYTLLRVSASRHFFFSRLGTVSQWYMPLFQLLAHSLSSTLSTTLSSQCPRSALEAAADNAAARGVSIRGLVVINPGNPTGQVLPRDNVADLVDFCRERGICLMADEVYQENIYKHGAEFVSFRKVAYENGAFEGPEDGRLALISFHSISKGFLGECGLRGGYFELLGIDPEVKAEISKLASISLCSNLPGQIATGLMTNPPVSGEPSFDQYQGEKEAILSSMKRRAERVSAALNALEGVSCNPIEGAMYAFPTISLSASAQAEAKKRSIAPDALYCMDLLESTGIVVVPGSGFLQQPGSFHLRTTILPPEDKIEQVIERMAVFHKDFMAKYP
jgi:alanine transaminase